MTTTFSSFELKEEIKFYKLRLGTYIVMVPILAFEFKQEVICMDGKLGTFLTQARRLGRTTSG
jgi:hypothetical protein